MTDLLPPAPQLAAFTVASFILAIAPGPGVLYIITRSLAQGRHAGLASVGGVALGNLGNAIGTSVGLATLFAVSSIAFTVVKYCGALYLVYLGVQALRSPRSKVHARALSSTPAQRVFRDGFFVALLNPKTAVFFGAFLPQFMAAGAAPILQAVTLGGLFVAIAAITDALYALAAGTLSPMIAHVRSVNIFSRYLAGCTYIGLGIGTALTGSRNTE